MIASLTRYRRAIGIPSRTVADRVILARPGREDFDALTGAAVAIWNLLQEARTENELIETLAWAYQVPRSDIERDVHALLEDLLERGVIEEGVGRDA
ncbi:MAG: PqqD family protein [Actinomycetota bacterium]